QHNPKPVHVPGEPPEPMIGPFIPWEFQERAILGGDTYVDGEPVHEPGILECIEEGEPARWPKSRDMGATYCVLMTFDWLCRFHKNIDVLLVSLKEDAVIKNVRSSLFGKLEHFHKHLPKWLGGPGAGTREKSKNLITYTDTESTINGTASTENAGVSE